MVTRFLLCCFFLSQKEIRTFRLCVKEWGRKPVLRFRVKKSKNKYPHPKYFFVRFQKKLKKRKNDKKRRSHVEFATLT